MNTVMQVRQQGISLGGLLVGAFLVVLISITGLKLVPAYIEYAQIKTVFTAISQDPTLLKASLHDIRNSFDRRASVDNIKAIKAEDIEITLNDGKPELSANYSIKIPMSGNVSILLEFNPSSGK